MDPLQPEMLKCYFRDLYWEIYVADSKLYSSVTPKVKRFPFIVSSGKYDINEITLPHYIQDAPKVLEDVLGV